MQIAVRLVALLLLLGSLAGCRGDQQDDSGNGPTYLSIGDSYAAGYRPASDGQPAGNTTNGFAWKVAADTNLTLVNYACSGMKAVDFVEGEPCVAGARPIGGPAPTNGSEAQAVQGFLAENADDVKLVTIILGGNDVTPCASDPQWRTCAMKAMAGVEKALDTLLTGIRRAVGDDVTIVGMTYPDVFLANPKLALLPDSDADPSLELFRDIVNPGLERVYERHGALFADVTKDFGAYIPVTDVVETEQYGTIPRRAAEICRLTYYCDLLDTHPTNEGHRKIADLVLATRQAS